MGGVSEGEWDVVWVGFGMREMGFENADEDERGSWGVLRLYMLR